MKLYRFFLPAVLGAAVSSSFGTEFPNPYPAPPPGVRLTPETPLSPSVNGARIVGATPARGCCSRFPFPGASHEDSGGWASLRPEDGFARLVTGTAPAKKGEYKVKIQGFQQAWKRCEGVDSEGGG